MNREGKLQTDGTTGKVVVNHDCYCTRKMPLIRRGEGRRGRDREKKNNKAELKHAGNGVLTLLHVRGEGRARLWSGQLKVSRVRRWLRPAAIHTYSM
jgi:hypothetical protein